MSSAADRKLHAIYYLPLEISDVWTCLPEFEDPHASFKSFWKAVEALYPEMSPDRHYTFASLQKFVLETSKAQISTLEALGHFHQRFLFLSTFLLQKDRLSPREQVNMFLQAIPSVQQSQILARLEIKYPDHHPDDIYPFPHVYEAATRVFISPSSYSSPIWSLPPPVSFPKVSSPESKSDAQVDVSSLVEALSKSISQSLAPAVVPAPSSSHSSPPSVPARIPQPRTCFFCGGLGHTVRYCPQVAEDVALGRCLCTPQGKVVLPSGDEIPRGLVAETIRERLDKWWKLRVSTSQYQQSSQKVSQVSRSFSSPRCFPDSAKVALVAPEVTELRRTQGQGSSKALSLPVSSQNLQSSPQLPPSPQSLQSSSEPFCIFHIQQTPELSKPLPRSRQVVEELPQSLPVVFKSSQSRLESPASLSTSQLFPAHPVAPVTSKMAGEYSRCRPRYPQTLSQLADSRPAFISKKSPKDSPLLSSKTSRAFPNCFQLRKSPRSSRFRLAESSSPQLFDSESPCFENSSSSPGVLVSPQLVPQSLLDLPAHQSSSFQLHSHSQSTRVILDSRPGRPQPQPRISSRFFWPTPPSSPQNALDMSEKLSDPM